MIFSRQCRKFLKQSLLFLQCRFHQLLNFFQAGFALGFEAEDQDGAGVGRPQQSPAVGENNAHSIHVHDLVALAEFFLDQFHQPEFFVLRAIDPDFRGVVGPGQVGQPG